MKTLIVPISGGKDSQAVLRLAIETRGREGLRVVHQSTGYDHPKTYDHLAYMERRYEVKIEFTQSERFKDIFDFIEKDKHFPHGQKRSCTRALKQLPFKAWLRAEGLLDAHILMGMRAAESSSRAARYGAKTDDEEFRLGDLAKVYDVRYLDKVTLSLPIVHWSTKQVFAYLKSFGDELNPLYEQGFDRVGCFPCLLGKNKDWELAAQDAVGVENISRLLALEEFLQSNNPTKSLKIHPTRDIRGLLASGKALTAKDNEACGWCSI